MPTTAALLEQELSITLPEEYKSALPAHPFPPDSVGEEMLMSDAEWLLRRNRQSPRLADGLFLIGTNGSECEYYLGLNKRPDAVMKYNLETKRLSAFATSFSQYLESIRQIDAEISAKEALGDERARAIPQWRHAIRSQMPIAIALLLFFVVMPLIALGIRSLYRWLVE